MTMTKKYCVIGIAIVVLLIIVYVALGRQMPLHKSSLTVGDKRIYYIETAKNIHCDVAYIDVVVYEDGTYEYVYDLITVGNGSCYSDLYVWDGLETFKLSEAIALEIVELDDFLDSDFAIKRAITTE